MTVRKLFTERKLVEKASYRQPLLATFSLTSILFLGGCSSEQKQDKVEITGASTLLPILQSAGESLEKRYPTLRVQVLAGGSTKGVKDTFSKQNDLGAVARELTLEEKDQFEVFPVAYDGVAIITNSSTNILELTTEDLRKVYRKEITNWQSFNGVNSPITVVNKSDGHATLEVFLQHTQLHRREIKSDVIAGNNSQVIKSVANIPGSIGYVSIAEALAAIEINQPIKLIQLDGVKPTLSNVEMKLWPIRRTLYLVSRGEPSPWANVLLDFLQSNEGSQIIKEANYVPIS
ncbi:phosphate ABC transporter substrate-binding protein [Aliikangiella coralliicola]|nr:phosphate ABC transporter substrate-binding protein [Aliikangiella coralliicola]